MADLKKEVELLQYFDCYQASISLICDKYDKKSEMLFANVFGIEYYYEEKNIYDRLSPRAALRSNNFLSVIYGFEEIVISDIQRDIKEQLNYILLMGHELIVLVDAFGCPWNPAYKKKHLFHYYYIQRYEEGKKMYVCRDPFFSEKEYMIESSVLSNSILQILYIKSIKKNFSFNIKDIGRIMLHQYPKKEINQRYIQFKDDLENIKFVNELFEDRNPALCRIILSSKQIENNLRGITKLFQLLSREFNRSIFLEVANMCNISADIWKHMNHYLIKIFYKKKLLRDDIDILIKIIDDLHRNEIEIHTKIGLCFSEIL